MSLEMPIERSKADQVEYAAVQKSLDELSEKLTARVDADERQEEVLADLNFVERFMVRRLGARLPNA